MIQWTEICPSDRCDIMEHSDFMMGWEILGGVIACDRNWEVITFDKNRRGGGINFLMKGGDKALANDNQGDINVWQKKSRGYFLLIGPQTHPPPPSPKEEIVNTPL